MQALNALAQGNYLQAIRCSKDLEPEARSRVLEAIGNQAVYENHLDIVAIVLSLLDQGAKNLLLCTLSTRCWHLQNQGNYTLAQRILNLLPNDSLKPLYAMRQPALPPRCQSR